MRILLLFIIILLTSCVATPLSDPYTLKVYGESLADAANAQIVATQQAQVIERGRIEMQAAGTQQAWNMQATQTVSVQSAQFTANAIAVQSTQNAQAATQQAENLQATQTVESMHTTATAQVVEATAIAIDLVVAYEREVMQKQIFWVGIREAGKTLFLVCMMAILGLGLWKYPPIILDWIIEWIDRRNTLFDSRSGTTAFILTDGGRVKPMLLANVDHYRDRPMLDSPIANPVNQVTLSANQVSATSPLNRIPERTLQISAIEYMRKCEPDSNQLVSCEKSGINKLAWMQITDSMENAGLIHKEPDKGTYVIDGTCKDVLYTLETKQVILSPAPPRYTPVEQLKCSEMV